MQPFGTIWAHCVRRFVSVLALYLFWVFIFLFFAIPWGFRHRVLFSPSHGGPSQDIFFNYIYSRIPILTFSENGNFTKEIDENKFGIIFNENTTVKDFVTLLTSYDCKGYDNYDFSKFKIDNQIQKLVKVFE